MVVIWNHMSHFFFLYEIFQKFLKDISKLAPKEHYLMPLCRGSAYLPNIFLPFPVRCPFHACRHERYEFRKRCRSEEENKSQGWEAAWPLQNLKRKSWHSSSDSVCMGPWALPFLSVCSTSPLPHILIFLNIKILAKVFLPDREAFDISKEGWHSRG